MGTRPPHWAVLGIDPTTDLRAIKRAYAALLKSIRADDDIDAFQRLRQAYECALAEAGRRGQTDRAPSPAEASPGHAQPPRSRQGSAPSPSRTRVSPPPLATTLSRTSEPTPSQTQVTTPPQRPVVPSDPERIAARLHEALCEVPVTEIGVWLDKQEDLLPLSLRDHISAALLERVIDDRDFGYARVLMLRQVFGWNDVHLLNRLVALRPGRLNGRAILQRFRLAEMEAMAPMPRRGALARTEAPPLPPGVASHADARPRRRMSPLQIVLVAVLATGTIGALGVGAVALFQGVDVSGLFSGGRFAGVIVVAGLLIRALASGGGNQRRR